MNKQRKTSHILNVFQYDVDGHVVLPASLTLTVAPAGNDNSGKVGTTAWVRSYVSGLNYLTGNQSITFSGDATGTGTTSIALTLANTAVTPGTYGSTTLVPVVTVDAKGRVTNVTTAAISGSLTFTGDVTGTGTTGTSTGLTLANSGVTAGTYTKVTVDSKGRVTVGASATTSDISEGTNLYYTDARVLAYLGANNYATQSYVSTQINNLVSGAPGLLDTLDELAAALGDDPNFATTVSTALGNRLRIDTAAQGLSGTQQSNGRTNLGLGTAATSNTGDFVAYRTFGTAANSAIGDFVAYRTFGTAANNNTGDFALASHTHSIANVTGLQTALDGKQASGSYAASSHSHIISDVTGLQTALDGKQASLGYTPYNSTNPSGYISSYTETDTLASVTGRGATTTSPITINGGGTQPLSLTTTSGSPWHIALNRTDLGLTSRVFAHNSPYSGWYFEHNISIAGNTNWHSGNLTNLNQLSNGPGYITSYSETDTLSSVISRGNTTGGNIITSANMYASIFYDYANNGYYGDFAGTSNMYRLQLGGGAGGTYAGLTVQASLGNTGPIVAKSLSYATTWSILPWTAGTTYISTGTYYDNGTWIHASSDSTNALFKFSPSGTSWYSSDNSTTNWNVATDSPLWNSVARWVNNVTAPNDVRAPIFYDSNDTSYYLDPNGNSVLTTATFNVNASSTLSIIAGGTNATVIRAAAGDELYIGGNNSWQMRFSGANVLMDNGGYLQNNESIRAPIFYDSNDTAYYLNPAGGSRLRNLYVGDSGDDWSDPGGWGTQVRFSNGPHVRFVLHARTPGIEAGMYVHTPGSVFIGSYTSHDVSMMYAGNRKMQITNSYIYTDVYLEAAGSLRAPIFYDSNNTSYYGDFAGISSMYGVAIRGDLSSVDSSNQIFFWGSGNSTTSAIGFKANGGSFGNPTGFGDGYNTYLTMDTDGRGWVFRRGVGGTDFGSAYTAGWILNNGIWQANAQMRAPQFRFTNSGNNAYFFGESSWGARIQTDSGYIWFGPANSGHAHIYTDRPNFYFNAQLTVNGGSQINTSDIRANIFYDQQDTNYYVDPNSTSRVYHIHADYLSVGQAINTTYRIITNGDYYANGGGNFWAEGRFKQYRGSGTWHDVIDSGNIGSQSVSSATTASLVASNLWSSSSGNEAVRVYAPGGASASWDGGITGAFRIKLPQRANNTMWSMTVRIYNYSTNQVSEYTMGNYSYDQGGYNASAHFIGAASAPVYNVRFGNQDGVDCVWIGETSSGWSYPVVSVIDFQGGFRGGNASTWDDGWNITYVTSFGTVATTIYPSVKFGNVNANDISAASVSASNVYASSDVRGNDVYTTGGWFRNHTNSNGIYWSATGWHLMPFDGADFRMHSGSSGAVALRMETNGSVRGYVYANSSNEIGFLNSGRGWSFRVENGGRIVAHGPIARTAHSAGFLEGSYNNIGGNSAYTNPIYTIGSSYNPTDSSLSNMYGIGYAHPNLWGSGKTSDWGMYVCNGGTINATLGSGAVTIWASNDIVAFSDARVKDNVEVVTNAIEKIQAIRGVTFTRKDAALEDKNKRHAGVIAQEVLKVLPEVVSGTEEDMYSVAYGNMAALFIEAIKEQQLQIEELKTQINYLVENK